MARPRGGEWLSDEMEQLRATGVDVLVSMLTTGEAYLLGLAREEAEARAAGLEFITSPTVDRALPSEADAFRDLVRRLVAEMDQGRQVVVHCRMGIGRSSMVVAAMLMARGVGAREAWASVSAARGFDVPDSPAQREWVEEVMAAAG